MIKLLDCPYSNRLIEAFQSNDIKFAFVNTTDQEDTYQILMPFVKCREYFNELLMTNYHPDEFTFKNVHGFQYNSQYKINLEEVLIALKFPNKSVADTFLDNLPYLHKIEESNGVDKLTEVHKVKTTNTYLIKASKLWIQKCILLNLYTLVIKLMTLGYPTKPFNELKQEMAAKGPWPTEISYVERVTESRLINMLENLAIIAEFPSKYVDGSNTLRDPYSVHTASGIVTVMSYRPDQFPQLKEIMQFLQDTFPKKAA